MPTTVPVRVPERVQQEIQVASRITGLSAAELVDRAWALLKRAPEFETELRASQQALASGDLDEVTDLVMRVAARSKAQRIREGPR